MGFSTAKVFFSKKFPQILYKKRNSTSVFFFLQKISDFPSSAPLIKRHAERG